MQVFCEQADFAQLTALVTAHKLPLDLQWHAPLDKKSLVYKLQCTPSCQALMLNDTTLSLVSCFDNFIKVTPAWQKLQRRVVSAGRKSELLLQAIKPDNACQVLDGTAGFGYDSLLLASTGAKVVALERDPILALLLLYEYQMMARLVNWQGLLSRLTIIYGDFLRYEMSADVIYLDPMFPKASYDAKVSKTMQALHQFVAPPNNVEEETLLAHADKLRTPNGKVVIKRPINAPFLANIPPVISVANNTVRFDRY